MVSRPSLLEALRKAVEGACLDEIKVATEYTSLPSEFESAFCHGMQAGDQTIPAWHDAFTVYFNEQIKTNERFRSIWFATELASVKALGLENNSILKMLEAQQHKLIAELKEIRSTLSVIVGSMEMLETNQARLLAMAMSDSDARNIILNAEQRRHHALREAGSQAL